MTDLSDRKAHQRAMQQHRIQTIQRHEDLRLLLQTPAGRRILHWLLTAPDLGNLFGDVVGGDMDETNRNIGAQRIGRLLQAELEEASPEAFFRILEEFRPAREQQSAEQPEEIEEIML